LHKRYGDKAAFLAVYVREAHPTDAAASAGNEASGIGFRQPRTLEERTEVATKCHAKLDVTIPLVVDTIDDRVGHAYSGMPDRLYLIDQKGKVAYQSGRGPFGFKPGELEQSLIGLLLDLEGTGKRAK
jgi:hypothetical protein